MVRRGRPGVEEDTTSSLKVFGTLHSFSPIANRLQFAHQFFFFLNVKMFIYVVKVVQTH